MSNPQPKNFTLKSLMRWIIAKYVKDGYIYSGGIPVNHWLFYYNDDNFNLLQLLAEKGILQRRNCQAWSYQLPARVRYTLIKKYNLIKRWNRSPASAFYPTGKYGEITLVKREVNPEPWELTQKEYINRPTAIKEYLSKPRTGVDASLTALDPNIKGTVKRLDKRWHEYCVKQALKRGEDVPQQVLQDYPELTEQAVTNKLHQNGIIGLPSTKRYQKRWEVPSQNGNGTYVVSITRQGEWQCSCPHWKFRRVECKHIKQIKKQTAA